MLKGIDVTLYTKRQTGEDAFGASVYEETPEVVRNVLIGAPLSRRSALCAGAHGDAGASAGRFGAGGKDRQQRD